MPLRKIILKQNGRWITIYRPSKTINQKELGIENSEDISQVTVADLQDSNEKEGNKDNQIAIYYAYGDIVDGTVEGLFSQNHTIDAQKVCKDLEKLSDDKKIKAVVIRINSGGGSAYASEQIWHQIIEIEKTKASRY